MKKVVMVVTNGYDPDERVHKEAIYLKNIGYDIEVIAWDRSCKLKENEYIDDINITRIREKSVYGTGVKQLIPYIKFIIKLRKYLRDENISFLHAHDLDGIIASYFTRKKSKLIFDMHEFYDLRVKSKLKRFFIKSLVNFFESKSDFIVYVNEFQKKRAKNKNKSKFIYLPNYPDTDNLKLSNKIKSNNIRINYIGVVRQFNEIKRLMDAVKDINNIEVNIHGDGTDYLKLKKIEKNYNNVTITGKYDYQNSQSLYNNTDILYCVYPDDNEQYRISYPIKFFEAIITATPVMVSKNTVIGEFTKKHNIGFNINYNSLEDIKNTILKIVNNRNLLIEKQNELKKISSSFKWSVIVKNLNDIYF